MILDLDHERVDKQRKRLAFPSDLEGFLQGVQICNFIVHTPLQYDPGQFFVRIDRFTESTSLARSPKSMTLITVYMPHTTSYHVQTQTI